MFRRIAFVLAILFAFVTQSLFSATVKGKNENESLDFGLRLQTWAQWTQNGVNKDTDRVDFSVRRFYFYVGGSVHPKIRYFSHFAADKIGMAGLDSPGVGLGSGLAVRDAWVVFVPSEAFKVQLGRMLVPFLRNSGTTGTFSLHSLDCPQWQHGAMVPGRRVARDDGVTVWGNLLNRVQYRLAVMDGSDISLTGKLRYAGRLSCYILGKPESNWFNQGAYLAKGEASKLVAVGVGFDSLQEFTKEGADHLGVTGDVFVNLPIADDSANVVLEGGYARIDQDNTLWTGNYLYGIAGVYLIDFRLDPYVRFEQFEVDDGVRNPPNDKRELSAGVNYHLNAQPNSAKVTLDWTRVEPRTGDAFNRVTGQLQLSF